MNTLLNIDGFLASLVHGKPPEDLHPVLAALWWDANGKWNNAHKLVEELETPDAMAVHAYLHRKEGDQSNADYWYRRAGQSFRRSSLEAEWHALVDGMLETAS